MKTIKLSIATIEAGARSAKVTPERFVSDILSISRGHRVCAHIKSRSSDFAVFSFSEGVRTRHTSRGGSAAESSRAGARGGRKVGRAERGHQD